MTRATGRGLATVPVASGALATIPESPTVPEPPSRPLVVRVDPPTPPRTDALKQALVEACSALRGGNKESAELTVKDARDEVARLGRASAELHAELELLNAEVDCARANAACASSAGEGDDEVKRARAAAKASAQDAALYRDPLEAVTTALIAQGAELQTARARIRRLESGGAAGVVGVAADDDAKTDELETMLGRLAAQQLERQRVSTAREEAHAHELCVQQQQLQIEQVARVEHRAHRPSHRPRAASHGMRRAVDRR